MRHSYKWESMQNLRVAAFKALPTIRVVQPVYHSAEGNRGHGSFLESGNWRFNWDRVFANSKGYVIASGDLWLPS